MQPPPLPTHRPTMPSEPLTQRTWFVVVALVVFFPVGLVLVWRRVGWTVKTKWIVTLLTIGLFLAAAVAGGQPPTEPGARSSPPANKQDSPPAPTRSPTPTPKLTPTPTLTPSPTPMPTPPPTAEAGLRASDKEAIRRAMASLIDFYNKRRYAEATRSLADSVVEDCGGAFNTTQAMVKNRQTEKLRYRLDAIANHETQADGSVTADVSVSSFDDNSGDQYDDHLAMGLRFDVDDLLGWVLRDMFPLGVSAFC